MAGGVAVDRDMLTGNPADVFGRLNELEARIDALERRVANLVRTISSGTAGATEQGWIYVEDADGNGGYIRIYAAK